MCDRKPAEIGDGAKRSTLSERAAAEREPSPTRLTIAYAAPEGSRPRADP